MKLLKVLSVGKPEPTDYTTRLTAKAVVMDKNGNTALFSGLLLGGGVKEVETIEEALHRECIEEAGITVEILRSLGVVVQYRDKLKKKYEIHGFLARVVGENSTPTTKQSDELGKTTEWLSLDEARIMFEKRISELESLPADRLADDSIQGKLYNTITALIFLNEATK